MMFEFDRFIHARERTESQCANDVTPTGTNGPIGTVMGITPGWADLYLWSQTGNYVEFGTNGDGLYLVRSTADANDWILETNETDNTSYAFIRVTGEQITVLERGYGTGPWDADKRLAEDGLRLTP